jgi:two-component system response regulator DevR
MSDAIGMDAPLRVLIVDDHEVVRHGVVAMLEVSEDIVVVGEAGTVRGAVAEAERLHPDVVVMDVRLADGSGIEATRRSPTTRPCSPRSWRERPGTS